jgi:hypothetical protein
VTGEGILLVDSRRGIVSAVLASGWTETGAAGTIR